MDAKGKKESAWRSRTHLWTLLTLANVTRWECTCTRSVVNRDTFAVSAMSAMMADRAENCTFSKRFSSRENVPLPLVREIKSLPFLPFQLCNARLLDFLARSSHGYTSPGRIINRVRPSERLGTQFGWILYPLSRFLDRADIPTNQP